MDSVKVTGYDPHPLIKAPIADMTVTLVVAIGANGVIGVDGGLPWRLPEDLATSRR